MNHTNNRRGKKERRRTTGRRSNHRELCLWKGAPAKIQENIFKNKFKQNNTKTYINQNSTAKDKDKLLKIAREKKKHKRKAARER